MRLPHLRVRPPLALRRLYGIDRAAALEFCNQHPVDAAYIAENIETAGIGPSGALGLFSKHESRLVGVAWASGTLTPVGFSLDGIEMLAEFLASRGRVANSIVGPRSQVMGVWRHLEDEWGPAREVRDPQYSMVIEGEPAVAGDEEVRPALPEEAALVLPAAVAMFTEEVGYNPLASGNAYAMRSRSLIRRGRTFIKLGPALDGPGERVIFKADIGVLSNEVAQIQGVWTAPDLRGQGIATAGVASVVRQIRRDYAPTVSLYVNHYNHAALRVYGAVGFRIYSEWASVLL